MAESGQLMSAPAGAFPRMMSQEMSGHNFSAYHTATLETETFSRHSRASVSADTTFPGQHHVFSGSLELAVSSAVVSSAHSAALNSAVSLDGAVEQRQLPGAVVSSVASVRSLTASRPCVDVCLSHSPLAATHTVSLTTSLAAPQTVTVTAVCAKPVSSSSLLSHQKYVPQQAGEKPLLSVDVNSSSGQYVVTESKGLNHQIVRADDAASRDAVKLEPKVEVETSRVEQHQQPLSTDVIVDIKTEQLKHDIKSEVTSDEIVDQHIQSEDVKLSDAVVAEKPACDTELKNESRRKGIYWLLPVSTLFASLVQDAVNDH